jgi:hypothetical protein
VKAWKQKNTERQRPEMLGQSAKQGRTYRSQGQSEQSQGLMEMRASLQAGAERTVKTQSSAAQN